MNQRNTQLKCACLYSSPALPPPQLNNWRKFAVHPPSLRCNGAAHEQSAGWYHPPEATPSVVAERQRAPSVRTRTLKGETNILHTLRLGAVLLGCAKSSASRRSCVNVATIEASATYPIRAARSSLVAVILDDILLRCITGSSPQIRLTW